MADSAAEGLRGGSFRHARAPSPKFLRKLKSLRLGPPGEQAES